MFECKINNNCRNRHRARAIAAKKMLSNSATALSEILGITPIPTPSIIPSASATPHGRLTTLDDDVTTEKITTSTKSVADYFREKLLSKSSAKSGSSTPASSKDNTGAGAYDFPRSGLGSSQVRIDAGESETNSTRGLGFPSLSAKTFLAASSIATSSTPEEAPKRTEKMEAEVETKDISQRWKKEKKKDVGEKKRRKKED